MQNPLMGRATAVGAALALCCTVLTGAADPGEPEAARTGSPFPMAPAAAGSDWPPDWLDGPAEEVEFWAEAEKEVLRLVNQHRSEAGCAPLEVDERLSEAARKHSQDMAGPETFAHLGSSVTSTRDRALASGYERLSGEIVASGYETAEAAVGSWARNTGHRKVLLDCASADTGVGVVLSDDGTYWTQLFGYGA